MADASIDGVLRLAPSVTARIQHGSLPVYLATMAAVAVVAATPFLTELSQRTKDEIPTIYYQRHDYSGDSSRSSVVLNGETVRVGGSPAPGVRVDEILPDSVVLDYRGTQFRLRALNSWINL